MYTIIARNSFVTNHDWLYCITPLLFVKSGLKILKHFKRDLKILKHFEVIFTNFSLFLLRVFQEKLITCIKKLLYCKLTNFRRFYYNIEVKKVQICKFWCGKCPNLRYFSRICMYFVLIYVFFVVK